MTRYALFFCPAPSSSLWQFGSAVLGYDSARAEPIAHPDHPGVAPGQFARWAGTPGRYGFHATLQAPFHLRPGIAETALPARVAALAEALGPVRLGRLKVAPIGSFVALIPAETSLAINAFAASCVDFAAPLRAPLSETDRARRIATGLTPHQINLLDRYGYPYVHDQFRFHMTLTGALDEAEQATAVEVLASLYEPVDREVTVEAITLLRQTDRAARFTQLQTFPVSHHAE